MYEMEIYELNVPTEYTCILRVYSEPTMLTVRYDTLP